MIERLQLKALSNWRIKPNRKPLILRGARQVGKTTLINEFGQKYEQYISLNLEKKIDANFFESYSEAKNIVDALVLKHNLKSVSAAETLLFIDEIQEKPKALKMLRYFYEEVPDLHVIAAGSLLEFALNQVGSFPVGRIEYLYLFPLNFQEFLKAFQMDMLLEKLKQVPIDKVTHYTALNWFHKYALSGGMPEVVAYLVKNDKISEIGSIFEGIWASYRDDITKYAKNTSEEKIITHILQTAPNYLDKRISFQGFGNSNYRSREVGECFRALDKAKVIQLIYPGTSVNFPLIVDYKKSPRLQFLDTGILNFAVGILPQLIEVEDLSTQYKGALLPHLVTQELISLNQSNYTKPNFWVRQKKGAQAEVDLIYVYKGILIPIEIKSGKVGTLRSLHQFIERSDHKYAIRMYAGEFSLEKHQTPNGVHFILLNLPYYLATYLDLQIEYLFKKHPRTE